MKLNTFCHNFVIGYIENQEKEKKKKKREKISSNPSNICKMMMMFSISISRSCIFIFIACKFVCPNVVGIEIKFDDALLNGRQSCKQKCDKRKRKTLIGKAKFPSVQSETDV